jgi:pre-mRNA-processing factor 19
LKINYVALREMQGENTLILSASADKITKVWAHDTSSGEYIPKSTVRTHKGELTGLAVQPTNSIFALSCRQNVLFT